MFYFVSDQYKRLRRKAVDDSGAAGTEWIVAAAIVVLFTIPVLTLINSGSSESTGVVAEALENPEGATIGGNYAPAGQDGKDEDDTGSSNGSVASGDTQPAIPGLDMGVGYDITAAEARGGNAPGAYGADRSASAASPSRSAAAGGTGGRNDITLNGRAADISTKTGDRTVTPESRPVLAFKVPRRDKPQARQTEVRRTQPQENLRASGDVVAPSGHAGEPTAETIADTCITETRPKFIEREPDFDLGAGIDEELFADGSPEVGVKSDELFAEDEIRIVGDDAELMAIDCDESRALVTAAGEQLGDGTILGMVTISASTDDAPTRRASPSGLNGRDSLAIADGGSDMVGEDMQVVALATTGNDVPVHAQTEFNLKLVADATYAAGRAAVAEITAEVEYVAPRAPAVRQSGR